MANIIPFKAYRPGKGLEELKAALPYDVYNRQEATEEVKKHPRSFLKIDRAETTFDDSVDTYDPLVYEKAKNMLLEDIASGDYVKDTQKGYYIYELIMDGRSQKGIVACASIDDYQNNIIKKHENTRADKEQDRINHVDICNAQTGPIFLSYAGNETLKNIINKVCSTKPEYDFTSEDGITHRGWNIFEEDLITQIQDAFTKMDSIYIADGHHRCASAVKVGMKRRAENPGFTGDEEFNYFLSVLFDADELKIMDYNRVVKDLNGLTKEAFLETIQKDFDVNESKVQVSPSKKGEFGMYLGGKWYVLNAKNHLFSEDPVKGLDVSILQDYLLNPILGIQDPKTDKRIDFVGGIRGLKELERRCGLDMEIAFSMYPTSIYELFSVADQGLLMPPKSTWFEPKLRSGLYIHSLDN